MKKIEEVTCIKFQEKSKNNHRERVLYIGGSQISFLKNPMLKTNSKLQSGQSSRKMNIPKNFFSSESTKNSDSESPTFIKF